MRNISKPLVVWTLIILLIPSISYASWWNPFSWFSNWSFSNQNNDAETKLLEKRITELEAKINNNAISFKATTTQNKIPHTDQKSSSTSSVPVNIQKFSVTIVEPELDYKSLYNTVLIPKYVSFRDGIVASDIVEVKKMQTDSNQNYHLKYLTDLSHTLNTDIGILMNYNPVLYDQYDKKYNQIMSEYNQQKVRFVKENLINYIYNNKYQLHVSDIHINTANLLDMNDRLFNQKYASQFRPLKTQQETVEFANSFLIDMGRYDLAR